MIARMGRQRRMAGCRLAGGVDAAPAHGCP
jgi:hypothetical protein